MILVSFLCPIMGFAADKVYQYDKDLLEEFNEPGLEVSLKGNKTGKGVPVTHIERQPASSEELVVTLHYTKK